MTKGILYIDSHGYRGFNNNFVDFLESKTKVLGGEFSLKNFTINENKLYYKDNLVNLEDFSHVFFCYRCDVKDLPIINENKQEHLSGFNLNYFKNLEDFFIKNTNLLILNKIKNYEMDEDRIVFFNKLLNYNIKIPKFKVIYEGFKYGGTQFNFKNDRCGMQHSLEIREPLLNYELVRYKFNQSMKFIDLFYPKKFLFYLIFL